MKKKKLFLIYFVITAVACGAAYFVGVQVADAMNSRTEKLRAEKYYQEREKFTKEALSYLKGLSPGDTLSDHRFEDIDRKYHQLSQLVDGPAAITFFDPDCESCRLEMKEVIGLVKDKEELKKFIYISSSNPRLIEELITEYDLRMPVLYDHRGTFTYNFQLSNYPFTIIVDKHLVVQEAIATPLTTGDIKRIASL